MKKRGVIEEHFLNKIVLFVDFKTMYLGRDLNQHGQAGRQEQASSSSPVTFHEVLLATAPLLGMPNALMPHTIATQTIDLLDMISFINFVSPI